MSRKGSSSPIHGLPSYWCRCTPSPVYLLLLSSIVSRFGGTVYDRTHGCLGPRTFWYGRHVRGRARGRTRTGGDGPSVPIQETVRAGGTEGSGSAGVEAQYGRGGDNTSDPKKGREEDPRVYEEDMSSEKSKWRSRTLVGSRTGRGVSVRHL